MQSRASLGPDACIWCQAVTPYVVAASAEHEWSATDPPVREVLAPERVAASTSAGCACGEYGGSGTTARESCSRIDTSMHLCRCVFHGDCSVAPKRRRAHADRYGSFQPRAAAASARTRPRHANPTPVVDALAVTCRRRFPSLSLSGRLETCSGSCCTSLSLAEGRCPPRWP